MTNHITTASQNRDFINAMFDSIDIVETLKGELGGDATWVLEWVAKNFTPDEVFPKSELEKWAEDAGYE